MDEGQIQVAFWDCLRYLWDRSAWEFSYREYPRVFKAQLEIEVQKRITWFELQGHVFEPPASDQEHYRTFGLYYNPHGEVS